MLLLEKEICTSLLGNDMIRGMSDTKLNIHPLLFLVRRTEMKKLERTCRDLPENQYCNVRIIPGTLLPY